VGYSRLRRSAEERGQGGYRDSGGSRRRIGAAIEAAIGDRWLDIEGGGRARIRLSDIRLAEDGDQDHYHYFAQINARVLAA
jgi:hypothetical protein